MTTLLNSGVTDKNKITELKEKRMMVFNKSKFAFLNCHRGIRPAKLHILMGTAGSGKSTLVRSIIGDQIENNFDSVYVWLSEESVDELKEGMMDLDLSDEILSRLLIESELDTAPKSNKPRDREILERVYLSGAKVLIIDNITTSQFYMDMKVSEQSSFIKRLKDFAVKTGIAVFLVAHTKKDIHDNMNKLINENDIRGSASVVNMAHFFYILQRFEQNKIFAPTIRVVKHRGYNVTERLFYIQYDKYKMAYVKDNSIEFKKFKEMFKERDKL